MVCSLNIALIFENCPVCTLVCFVTSSVLLALSKTSQESTQPFISFSIVGMDIV